MNWVESIPPDSIIKAKDAESYSELKWFTKNGYFVRIAHGKYRRTHKHGQTLNVYNANDMLASMLKR